MSTSATQDRILSNPCASDWIRNRPETRTDAGALLPLDERLQRLDACNFDFITATLNDELIQQGRAYFCEQAYPIILLALQVFIKGLSPRTPRQPRIAEEKKKLLLEFLQQGGPG